MPCRALRHNPHSQARAPPPLWTSTPPAGPLCSSPTASTAAGTSCAAHPGPIQPCVLRPSLLFLLRCASSAVPPCPLRMAFRHTRPRPPDAPLTAASSNGPLSSPLTVTPACPLPPPCVHPSQVVAVDGQSRSNADLLLTEAEVDPGFPGDYLTWEASLLQARKGRPCPLPLRSRDARSVLSLSLCRPLPRPVCCAAAALCVLVGGCTRQSAALMTVFSLSISPRRRASGRPPLRRQEDDPRAAGPGRGQPGLPRLRRPLPAAAALLHAPVARRRRQRPHQDPLRQARTRQGSPWPSCGAPASSLCDQHRCDASCASAVRAGVPRVWTRGVVCSAHLASCLKDVCVLVCAGTRPCRS